jgi:CRP-like cAMP-binding protein
MPIALKLARTPKERDDVLWVRHEVFVIEDGKFGGQPLPEERIIDRFDVIPDVENIIAYEDDEPVGTLRVNCDRGGGLPSEKYYDFSAARRGFVEELNLGEGEELAVASAGMLAVRQAWRSRRDVIRALFKVAASVFLSWKVTHIIASANHESAHMYHRLGFDDIDERQWVEEIGNFIIPQVTVAEKWYEWAFSDVIGPPLKIFQDSFERHLYRRGEHIFKEHDIGDKAYVIDSGNLKIYRSEPDGSQMVLALLGRGDLFGELALIDEMPRSASALALDDVELISLDRKVFLHHIGQDVGHLQQYMSVFSARMRHTDELAMVLTMQSVEERLKFALASFRAGARPSPRQPDRLVAKVTTEDLARAALVDQDSAAEFLAKLEQQGAIELSRKSIRFPMTGAAERAD